MSMVMSFTTTTCYTSIFMTAMRMTVLMSMTMFVFMLYTTTTCIILFYIFIQIFVHSFSVCMFRNMSLPFMSMIMSTFSTCTSFRMLT